MTARVNELKDDKPTSFDIAYRAGVSQSTVSRALRGERTVDPALAERVKEAASQLRYTPDPAARALASRHSSHVAVLIPMLSNALFVDLLEAVQRTLRPAGYQTLIGITHYNPDEEEQLLREQLQHRPAGLIVTGTDHSATTRALIEGSGVPCVHVMELGNTPGVYCVGFSQHAAGQAITEHLVQRGHKRIAFVAAQLDPRTLQRAEGYRRCLREQGVYCPSDAERRQGIPSCACFSQVYLDGRLLNTSRPTEPQSLDSLEPGRGALPPVATGVPRSRKWFSPQRTARSASPAMVSTV